MNDQKHENLFSWLGKAISEVKESYREADQKQKAQIENQKQAQQAQRIQSRMTQIAEELFHVFRNQRYPYVNSITNAQQIRFKDWKIVQERPIFSYSLDIRAIYLNPIDLARICRQMNADISRYRSDMLLHNGPDAFYPDFMDLWYGLQIKSVRNGTSDNELLIDVVPAAFWPEKILHRTSSALAGRVGPDRPP